MRTFSELKSFVKEAKNEAVSEALMLATCPGRKTKALVGTAGTLAAVAGTAGSAFAQPQFFSNLEGIFNNVFQWVLPVTSSAAALVLLFALIMYMFSTDPSAARNAKSIAIRVFIAYVLINSIFGIIAVAKSLTSGMPDGL